MKEDRRRGMRDLVTLRTLDGQSGQACRPQVVSRFARLENERARLMRELKMWNARKGVTERMLAAVEDELAGLKPLLMGEIPSSSAQEKRRRPSLRADGVPTKAEAPRSKGLPEGFIEY